MKLSVKERPCGLGLAQNGPGLLENRFDGWVPRVVGEGKESFVALNCLCLGCGVKEVMSVYTGGLEE